MPRRARPDCQLAACTLARPEQRQKTSTDSSGLSTAIAIMAAAMQVQAMAPAVWCQRSARQLTQMRPQGELLGLQEAAAFTRR